MVELGHVRDDGELVWDVAVHHVLVQERGEVSLGTLLLTVGSPKLPVGP